MSAKRRDSSFAPKRLFRELQWEVVKAVFLNELLNAAIIFFALNIVFALFNMSFIPSAIIAALVLVFRTTRSFHKSVLLRIEQGNPEVHEILRTAYEYQGTRTLMAQGLLYDLQRRLSTVSTGVLLDPRNVLMKIVTLALLAFIPVAITSFLPFLIQENPLDGFSFDAQDAQRRVQEAFTPATLNATETIYGNASVIQLGDEELFVEVTPGGSQVSFDTVKGPEQRSFEYNDYPIDVDPSQSGYAQSAAYSAEDRALVESYTCRARGLC